jgi:16S rRNA (guanine527-N7)-methyltransferase
MLNTILADGLKALHIDLDARTQQALVDFVGLLGRWNEAYNLTAVREPEQMVVRHVLDSLAVLPFVQGPRVIDIGTGPGLPGIPLALARPQMQFVLLDSNAKKISFVRQAIVQLGLKNVEAVQERVEKYRPAAKFNSLLSRAYASLADMLAGANHLCAPGGEFLAMKGLYPQEELAEIAPAYAARVEALQVPGLEAARHLVIITPR